jgi:ribonuclease BN (tRNA processing enzyme)
MWVKSPDCEPGYVYITHAHADHFLGLPEVLAAFSDAGPAALAESILAMKGQIAGHRDLRAADDDVRRQIGECRRYIADFEAALEPVPRRPNSSTG